MNILFLLAALAHSSGADSIRVLGNIPFGSAESHIEPSGVRLNRLWPDVSIPNVHYTTDDEIWGSEFQIDTGTFSNRKEQPTNLATVQGSTAKEFCKCSKPEETNTRSLPQQETHSLCETQRNLLEKYVTYADDYGDEANKKFGCKTLKAYLNRYRDAHQRASRHRDFDEQLLDTYSLCMTQRNLLGKDSAFVGSFGNSKVLATDSNKYETYEDWWSDLTTLQQGGLSHIGSAFLHGICSHNVSHYDKHTENLNIYENTDGCFDYGYENYLWIHDDIDYDEENNYRINLMNCFDTRNCLNRRLRNCYRRRNRYESKLMILTTKKMLTCRECTEACQRMENQHSLALQVYECGDLPLYTKIRRIPYGRAVCNHLLRGSSERQMSTWYWIVDHVTS